MSKEYYNIHCKDGVERQAIDVMRKALGNNLFGVHCLATAFKYISRIGRKPNNPDEQEREKTREYMKWAQESLDKNEIEYLIDKFCQTTELGEELEKYFFENNITKK